MTDDSRLFAALTARTREGKLLWSAPEGEGPNTFITVVQDKTFRFELTPLFGSLTTRDFGTPHLEVTDEHGESLFQILDGSPGAKEAWRHAKLSSRRCVVIKEALELLGSL